MRNRRLWIAGIVLGLTLLATLLTPLFGGKASRYAAAPAVLGFGLAAAAAVALLVRLAADPIPEISPGVSVHALEAMFHGKSLFRPTPDPVSWFSVGGVTVNLTLMIYPLSAVMLATVTFMAFWIAVFSAE